MGLEFLVSLYDVRFFNNIDLITYDLITLTSKEIMYLRLFMA